MTIALGIDVDGRPRPFLVNGNGELILNGSISYDLSHQAFKGMGAVLYGLTSQGEALPLKLDTDGHLVTGAEDVIVTNNWWLAGGVSAANCFGAYRGKGASGFAASMVNLNNSGTHDLYWSGLPSQVGGIGSSDGIAPDWNISKGWQGGGGNGQTFAMNGGCFAEDTWSIIIQFANASSFSQQFCGANITPGGPHIDGISLNNTGAFQEIINFADGSVGGVQLNGNLAIAGKKTFRDGVQVSTIGAGTGTCAFDWFWLSVNAGGAPHGGQHVTEMIAMAIYNTTLTDLQVAAIAAEMASF